MSTTSLVRSTSTSSGLVASPKPSTPTSTTVLPKLNLTPKTKPSPAQTPSQTPTPPVSTPGTPGQWQHPRMKEVMERQNKTNFDKNNVWAIGINAIAIFLTFAATALIYPLLPTSTILALRPYDTYALLLLRLLLSTNILIATLPLLRNKDACEDIPLTPAQRQLLGLPPMSRPATPQEKEQWITPPRYTRSRSGTPQSPGSSLRAQASGSPGSGSMFGNSMQRQGSGSPFGGNGSPGQWSPSSLTPLRGGVGDERRRLSYNARQSPLSASDFDSTMGTTTGMESASIGTPTRKGNRASVGLNSKWLYEKGKGSPRRGSGGGAGWDPKGWGTGSVFN